MNNIAVKSEDTHFTEDSLRQLEESGVLFFDEESNFFTPEEWETLEQVCLESELPYETVKLGDAGEPNFVEVGRFMTDVERPMIVNEAFSKEVLSILGDEKRLAFFSKITGDTDLYLRRAQVNKMVQGSFIGKHVDQDSNPDYTVSIVLQLGKVFSGGEFVVHLPDGQQSVNLPTYRSVIITRCDFAHEVKPVKDGARVSLVYFVSGSDGENNRHIPIPAEYKLKHIDESRSGAA